MERQSEKEHLEMISLMEQHELAIQKLYEAFAQKLPEQGAFWLKMAGEEAEHVFMMQAIKRFGEAGQIRLKADCPVHPQQIQHALKHIKLYLTELQDHHVSSKRAIAIARELEEGVLEKHHSRIFETECKQAQELLDKLCLETENHRKALEETTFKRDEFSEMVERGILSNIHVELARNIAQEEGRSLESVLISHFDVPKEEIINGFARFFRLEPFDVADGLAVPSEVMAKIQKLYEDLKAKLFVPVRSEGKKLIVALANPRDIVLQDDIRRLFSEWEIEFRVGLSDDILAAIDRLFEKEKHQTESPETLAKQLRDEEKASAKMEDVEPQRTREEESVVARFLSAIIEDAYQQGASDIHIEPDPEQNVEIRYRIDGVLRKITTCPSSLRNTIISRIKIMSGLDIAEHRKPQSGKIRYKRWGRYDIELRVEIYPTAGGVEDAAIRILETGKPKPLTEIGLSERNLETFKRIIVQPYGMFLCVGPTGSGKTTTLHSALSYINNETVKILTAEDPVEITQPGLRQLQINRKAGLTFTEALRSFLRSDPDVIMIGEMRDLETASIAIEASLTGHLVLSTLHTNSAPETVVRLLDMGIDPYSFADALLAVLGQRLVRTLCATCKQPISNQSKAIESLRAEYGAPEIFDEFVNQGNITIFAPAVGGCERCGGTGFKGRTAIHEMLEVNDDIRQLIVRKANVAEIRRHAILSGMRTLKQDGIEKVMRGLTTIEEVRAVCSR